MTPEERDLLQRMHDDAVANGDYQGAADLAALIATTPTTDAAS